MMLAGRWRRVFAWSAVLLLLGGCAPTSDNGAEVVVEGAEEPAAYQFVTVELGDVELTKRVEFTYRQQNEEEVSFALSGRMVDRVYVEERDTVKKGDLLAELSVGNLERQIEDLKYQIAREELLLEYVEVNENLEISQIWVNYIWNHMSDDEQRDEQVKAVQQNSRYQKEDYSDALELDRKALAELEQELKQCRVYAGIDGTVYRISKGLEGSTSRVGESVMLIVDNSQCFFEVGESELAGYFKEGETVSVAVTQGAAKGDYLLMPYRITEWGDTLLFSIFDGPMTSGIEVGTYGSTRIALDWRENVLCLPRLAVHNAQDRSYVFVMGEDDVRQLRWVETGLWGDDTVEIVGGLELGEKVIR